MSAWDGISTMTVTVTWFFKFERDKFHWN
jgi:hypothetical protein